jgi:hypothetical protein
MHEACSGKAFGMKDCRRTHQDREREVKVQCHIWYFLFISRGVETLLTMK